MVLIIQVIFGTHLVQGSLKEEQRVPSHSLDLEVFLSYECVRNRVVFHVHHHLNKRVDYLFLKRFYLY